MTPVIPPHRNRPINRSYDCYLYKLRHLPENAFLKLKQVCASPPDTQHYRILFLQQCRFDALLFFVKGIDDYIIKNTALFIEIY